MATRDRIVPIIVACPLFLQNLDTSVMATALPSIARSLDVQPLHLNLAITSYLLSLAVFLPASGWFAERFGARRVFCCAIAFFSIGSALCGAAQSLPALVLFRIIQGMGGALMVPVGRLILLRSVPASRMVAAMIWFTVPPAIGRMVGPLFGGAIVTWTSWRWIFLVNVPFGLLGIVLALLFIDELSEDETPQPFDIAGFVLLALGLTGVLGGLETVGKSLVAVWVTWTVAGAGALALCVYHLRSHRRANPLIDLGTLRYPTYFASIIGGTPLRIAIGASPFLLPLMLQLGFGLSALDSGLLTVATAIGSLATRTVMARAIRLIGFRSLLIGATALTSLFYASYGFFRPSTPHLLMFCTMMLGGLFNSMGMVALQTLGFSEIPKPLMSHATALSSMAQQLSLSVGVVLGASLVSAAAWWHGSDSTHLAARDFSPAFVVVGAITLISLAFFVRLDREEGADLR
ncbi:MULTISPECIES: MDR family MFS transporter [unclassified Variovorax]|uniref:MDR family MFS transporter n=1 Tax=unclassified Variovorax TaxID=663243 RepID=UPI001316A4F9|nr:MULTISPECIES: MDR family MFS transporter [unclassified Variovorax]VTU29588.1 High-copy suppressor of rspA [Variovorax sp. SRS16]VTU37273.1 High-copy suppressor of rspA [Variovorax sp. PBL-E5]